MLQTVQGFAVAKADGLAARIGRGHDQHRGQGRERGQPVKKYGVQRRVGQHEAHLARIGRDLWRQPCGIGGRALWRLVLLPARAEHHGLFRALQQGLVLWREGAEGASRGQVAHHEGQGLVRTCFAQAQLPQTLGVTGVAGQLKASQPLERQNTPLEQGLRGPSKCIVNVFGCGGGASLAGGLRVHKPQAWTAGRAGHGLGMEAPVRRVGVLSGALRAKGKAAHGRDGAVVRDGPRNGVARPAVGAVGKGVLIAGVGGVVHVGQTVGADAHVGAYKHAVPGLARAGNNAKIPFAFNRLQVVLRHASQTGQRGQLGAQAATKAPHLVLRALQLHAHAF